MSKEKGCLTKDALVESIYTKFPIDKQKAVQIVEDWIELIKEGLDKESKVMLSGFGVFTVKGKDPRPGRNPQTGSRITLDARRVVKFKCSQLLREELNGGDTTGLTGDEE